MAIVQKYKCKSCASENITKNGKAPNGKQKYHCKDCGRYGILNPSVKYTEEEKERILRAYEERSSLRGLERTFGVSRQTVAKWIKKSPKSSIFTKNTKISSGK